jgi:three-Cys-motif partner protein
MHQSLCMSIRPKRPSKSTVVETEHDEIGFWSEIKLDILKKYLLAYSTIIKHQTLPFRTIYIDAFAGSGKHVSKTTGEFVAGSPARALDVRPPFDEYHFVDMDKAKVKSLEDIARTHDNVTVHHGDCNHILLDEVFPLARFEDYKRALCLLDPYSLQLHWDVIQTAAKMRSVEIFLNFPIMDINRNVLRKSPTATKVTQMTLFWGDESWRDAAYRTEVGLFDSEDVKVENFQLVAAFRERLRSVAGFRSVPEPIAMRNTQRAAVYYLFFAGPNETGSNIARDIFNGYRKKGYG